jgi:hypothetical protein
MSHVYDLFTLVLLVWACLRAIRRGGGLAHLAVGLSAGLHVLVRTQNIVTVMLLLAYFWLVPSLGDGRRGRFGRSPRHAAVLLAALLVALLPLAAWP